MLQNLWNISICVRPAIYDRVQLIKRKQEEYFNKNNRLIEYKENDIVMIKPDKKLNSLSPSWTGPFIVKRKTIGGSYILSNLDNTDHPTPIPPARMKKGYFKPIQESFEVEKILGHKELDGKNFYLTKWLNKDFATWEPFESFNQIDIINNYWKSQNQNDNYARRTKGRVSSRKDGC